MPLAFFIVLAATLVGSWYQMENYEHQRVLTLKSEAGAVASNMLSYKDWINRIVKYQVPGGSRPNYANFQTWQGDAETFIDLARSNGNIPATMSWFKGPMPGVSAWIDHGKVYLYYAPLSSAHVTQQGVQAELLKLTNGSYGVGKALPVNTG